MRVRAVRGCILLLSVLVPKLVTDLALSNSGLWSWGREALYGIGAVVVFAVLSTLATLWERKDENLWLPSDVTPTERRPLAPPA